MNLFEKLHNRRLLVRLVGVRMSELVHGNYQMRLFDEGSRLATLYHSMDDIRQRFGEQAIQRAIGMRVKSIGHFNPFRGETPVIVENRIV
jgi:DNA polymerase-4